MTAYWEARSFADTIGRKVPGVVEVLRSPDGFPILLLRTKAGHLHLACAPGFLSPGELEALARTLDFVVDAGKTHGAATAFLQYRGVDEPAAPPDLPTRVEPRKMVLVDLPEDDEALLAATRRDTRSRLRQVTAQSWTWNTDLHPAYGHLYEALAERNGFSATYRYASEDFPALLASGDVWPVMVTDGAGALIGGAIVGRVSHTVCDYIISAYDEAFPNAGRATLWHTLRAARSLGFRCVNLGGGVREDDALFLFKMSFAGRAAPFYSLKIVLDADAYRGRGGALDLAGPFPNA